MSFVFASTPSCRSCSRLGSSSAARSSRLRRRGRSRWQKQVVVAERLVMGQNPASAQGVAEAMVRLLHREAR
ncbi:hypothetical protein WMF04_02570 [Sorangium sp. So ce260]|uniref:hypothetical protein n=1 Tax=Sorangium sp. So ce260 TaxID=3133291 RepID=UPI003F5D794D